LAKTEIIAGLDIGTSKVATTAAEADRAGSIEILGAAAVPSVGLKKGVVVDMEATVSAIRSSVERAANVAGVEIGTVVVNVTGEHISSLNSRAIISIKREDREISPEDVERVLEESKRIVLPPEREIIHAIPRGFAIDGQDGIRDPSGMNGSRLEVETHIVTGATTHLQNVAKCVHRAGLDIQDRVHQPLATGEAVVLQAEKDLGVALIDIGGGTTDVAIYIGGEVTYSALIPVGGNHITQDIATLLPTSPEEAERVKIEQGCAMMSLAQDDETFEVKRLGAPEPVTLPRKQVLAQIMEPRCEEIFSMVKQHIYKSGFAEVLPAGAVITGGGSLLPGMCELAEKILGMRARLGTAQGVGGLVEQISGPTFATSVGLILYQARRRTAEAEEGRRSLLGSLFGMFRGKEHRR